MKQLPRIAARLYCEPWSILPSQHEEICNQFRSYLERSDEPAEFSSRNRHTQAAADDIVGPVWRDAEGKLHAWHTQVQIIGSVAILPIVGTLGKHLSTLEMWCGASDYGIITKQAAQIAADPRITDVIFNINSPGGQCVGGLECAKALLELGKIKSTIAYTDQLCASAAYFLAAAADRIVVAPSAIIGSISTYTAFLDKSRRYEMEGVEVRMFRSGEVKGAGYPGKVWTPEEITAMQLVTDQFSAQFKGFCRERRGLSEDVMQGAYWPGEFAPEGILDDYADSIDALLSTMAAAASRNTFRR